MKLAHFAPMLLFPGCALLVNLGSEAGDVSIGSGSTGGSSASATGSTTAGAVATGASSGSGTSTGGNSGAVSSGSSGVAASSGRSSSGGAAGTSGTGTSGYDVGDGGYFQPPVVYTIGTAPHALTTFRDDAGNVGLAVGDYGDGRVFILSGKGDGTFIDAGSYSPSVSGAQIQTLCSADFNRDGIPDVAADFWYDVGSQDLMLLTGQAGGGFSTADSNLVGDQTYEMITADMNGDSIPDLVVILDRALVIGLGLGDGGFAWGLPIGNLGIPRGLAVGDFGQIGSLQIAVADNAGSAVYVVAQIDGGFTNVGPFDVGVGPVGIATADFNGDGCEDVVTGNNVGDSITVLISSCKPGVRPIARTYSLLQSIGHSDCQLVKCGRPQWVVTGEFDGTGGPDIAVAFFDALDGGGGQNVAIFQGNGNGTFKAPEYLKAGDGPSDIVAADFNGDGRTDLAVVNKISNDISIFLHR